MLERQRARFRVAALTAHSNAGLLEEQAAHWMPDYVGLVERNGRPHPGWHLGTDCLVEAATCDSADDGVAVSYTHLTLPTILLV